jgi:DNA-binding transcriptional ArsR family regulator
VFEQSPSPALLAVIARRFRTLADPARLLVLHTLEAGERSVSELRADTGLAQGTVSKHLQVLHQHGFVSRRRDGQFVYYRLADDAVLQLCELMCDRLDAELAVELADVREALSA